MKRTIKNTGYIAALPSLLFAGLLHANVGDTVLMESAYNYAQIDNQGGLRMDVVDQAAKPLQIAAKPKEKKKSNVKTKKDGTIVVKEKHKTNDGEGNKTSTKTKTTIPPSGLSR